MTVFSYLSPKVRIARSAIHGRGFFAHHPIRKGEIVCIFGGKIVAEKEYRRLCRRHSFFHDYPIKVAPGFYLFSCLTPRQKTDQEFINHSCEPSAGFRGQIVLEAMRHIKPGEEITYDYALTDDDPDDFLRCHCRTSSCRHVIRGSDWKKPKLQRKYRGYFAWHIQEKIDQLKQIKS